jgi:hypothetical protein
VQLKPRRTKNTKEHEAILRKGHFVNLRVLRFFVVQGSPNYRGQSSS